MQWKTVCVVVLFSSLSNPVLTESGRKCQLFCFPPLWYLLVYHATPTPTRCLSSPQTFKKRVPDQLQSSDIKHQLRAPGLLSTHLYASGVVVLKDRTRQHKSGINRKPANMLTPVVMMILALVAIRGKADVAFGPYCADSSYATNCMLLLCSFCSFLFFI